MDWTMVIDVFKILISLIDKMVYWFMDLLISIFNTIAKIQLFSEENGIIEKFADRLYVLIAIIMVFKVSFSIIQYIINPDSFSDKEKGMGKVIQSILLVLVALVGVRYVFDMAYDLQKKVVDTNTIEKIVLGIKNVGEKDQKEFHKMMPFTVLSAFVQPRDGYQDEYKEFADSYAYDELLSHVNDKVSEGSSLNKYEYKFLISTIAGAFVVIIYLNFCIDLAIRAAKFGFLQLIAPIPIISMIDPKSSKSGMMSKWVKECFSTYLGLFIRIAAVSFVLFLIQIIMSGQINLVSSEVIVNSIDLTIYINLVLIFGALMFAKNLPKLISDLTGVDLKGDFKLNPLKRIPYSDKALKLGVSSAGTVASGALGAVGGALAGVGSNIAGRRVMGDTKGARIKSGIGNTIGTIAGGVNGLFRGGATGLKLGAKDHGKHIIKNAGDAEKQAGQRASNEIGTNFLDRGLSAFQQNSGFKTKAQQQDEEIKQLEEFAKGKSDLKAAADFDDHDLSGLGIFNWDKASDNNLKTVLSFTDYKGKNKSVKNLKQYYEDLQNSGTASESQITAAREAYEAAQKFIISNAGTKPIGNTQVQNLKHNLSNYTKQNKLFYTDSNGKQQRISIEDMDTYETINIATINAQTQVGNIKSGYIGDKNGVPQYAKKNEYEKAHRTDEAVKNGSSGGK